MLNIITISELYDTRYFVTVVNAMKTIHRTDYSFSCIGNPKDRNMLLYLDGCKAEYTRKNGSKVYANSGDIIYTPIGSEYSMRILDFSSKNSNMVGVNLYLHHSTGTPFILFNDIQIYCTNDICYKLLFSKIADYSETAIPCPGKMQAGMLDILSNLSIYYRNKNLSDNRFSIISKGILYLENDNEQNLNISDIAQMCNVSEVYFRSLFKEYSGLSPSDYRMNVKIHRAKQYLSFEYMSIAEVAERLGFTDSTYFVKQFKKRCGMTPLQYKKSIQNGTFDSFSNHNAR